MPEKKTFIIAEIAQAHDGSLGILHSYIDALAETGIDAIKFQTHIAEAESSIHEPFRVKFSYEDATRFDYWKRMEFTYEQWIEIKAHCEKVGLEFMSSPFSIAAADMLNEIGMQRFKIGSGEVNNLLLLEKIGSFGKPVLLSSGMSSLLELDDSVNFLKSKNIPLSIFQCTTQYPTQPESLGLNVIEVLKERYKVPVGLSDHSGKIYPSLGAVALGAEMLEFHVVFDRRMFGPDAKSSLLIDEVKQLVEGVRYLDKAVNHPIDKTKNEQFKELKTIFEKSLAINKDLKKGHVITLSDLEAKKPKNHGVPAADYKSVLGKKLNKDLVKYSFLNAEDIA